jgi:hypothetical protein
MFKLNWIELVKHGLISAIYAFKNYVAIWNQGTNSYRILCEMWHMSGSLAKSWDSTVYQKNH